MEQRDTQQVSGDKIEPIPEPEPAHLRDDTDSDDEREATELQTVIPPRPRIQRELSQGTSKEHWYNPIKKYWRHHIRLSVPHVDCRDHLANERTFLGYLRTSVALSMLGAVIAQLYRLGHSPNPDPVFGYYVLSRPLCAILQCSALGMVLLGSIRYFRQQSAMASGKVYAGGWEILTIMAFVGLFIVALFVLHVALDISKY